MLNSPKTILSHPVFSGGDVISGQEHCLIAWSRGCVLIPNIEHAGSLPLKLAFRQFL